MTTYLTESPLNSLGFVVCYLAPYEFFYRVDVHAMTSNVVNVIMPPPKYHLPPKTLSVGSLRNVCGVGSIGMAMLWA